MKKLLLFLFICNFFLVNKGITQINLWDKDSLLVIQEGTASFYGKRFHKRKTASGEIFDMKGYTAAHKHLPFGTMLKVTNMENGYEVIVEVNDRLPKHSKRIIDLSRTAAEQLDMIHEGLTKVKLQALSFDAIKEIKAYYKVVPKELRLRVYHESIEINNEEMVISFPALQINKEVGLIGLPTL